MCLDVDSFIPFLNEILKADNVGYVELCHNDDCSGPLERNVFGRYNAWSKM
jgi:hypothetical protein